MPANHTEIEKHLWDAADELRANSKLKSSEYSVPVLGLIFLRYADAKFSQAEKALDKLPEAFTPELYQQKCDTIYQHVYDSYYGMGRSLYSITGVREQGVMGL